jgi:hypothetical protein
MSFIHFIRLLAIAISKGGMQAFIDRIFKLHAMQPVYVFITPTRGNSIMLIVLTFIVGRLIGMVLSTLWNRFIKENKKKK